MHRYLSKCQGTKYAVTAVHTLQENPLFDVMLDDLDYSYLGSKNETINFELMATAWSKLCASRNYTYIIRLLSVSAHIIIFWKTERNTVILSHIIWVPQDQLVR